MYRTTEFVEFALAEFERGLDGLTEDEATTRLLKADGTRMNAISWIMAHVAWQWFRVASHGTLQETPASTEAYRFLSDDPTPPPMSEALMLLQAAHTANAWIGTADEALLGTVREGLGSLNESVGTFLMRTILHTWFHTGEVNAIRQMLGHPEIRFVGRMNGNLEWRPEGDGRVAPPQDASAS